MARIFTTPETEQNAKFLMRILLAAADIRKDPEFAGFRFDVSFKQSATAVCNELINRDFNNTNVDINILARYSLQMGSKRKKLKPEAIAKSVVYMAELLQLYWDDTIRTPYEIDEFKKSTLGEFVYKYGRLISTIKDKGKRTSKSTGSGSAGSSSAAGNSSASSANNAAKSGFKQSGPQSGNARDLQGQPNVKWYANGKSVYKIVGDKIGQSVPNAFVKPLNPKGAAGSTNAVFVGTGKGYGECTCFFDDINDANDFLNKINQSGKVKVNISNLRIVKTEADKNGYFLVGTEFGVCAISANKLNESISEEVETTRDVNWEKATEGYSREEINELHTWMRRG